MSKSNKEFLGHIFDECDFILEHTNGIDKKELFDNIVFDRLNIIDV